MLQKQVGPKASPTKSSTEHTYREINLANYHAIRHTRQLVPGLLLWQAGRKMLGRKLLSLFRAAYTLSSLSLQCISFLGNMSLCYSGVEGSHADEKPTVPVIILGKSKSEEMLTVRLLCCTINPFTHTLNQSCVDVPLSVSMIICTGSWLIRNGLLTLDVRIAPQKGHWLKRHEPVCRASSFSNFYYLFIYIFIFVLFWF